MNFDRYNNASQFETSIDESIPSIQVESERIRILSKNCQNKVLIFIDKKIPDHKMLITYYQRKSNKKLVSVDPYLHYDLYYNTQI